MERMAPDLEQQMAPENLRALLRRAREEDMGPSGADLTSALALPADGAVEAAIRPREAGRLAGAACLETAAAMYDERLGVTCEAADGDRVEEGDPVATVRGPARSVLALERVALNLISHLSGIATRTARCVAAAAGTGVYDTRKTLPGLRALQKYAVVCGGGHSHRWGLHDAVLLKDNHFAASDLAAEELARQVVAAARAQTPAPAFVEVEVEAMGMLSPVLAARPDIVLLDNMGPRRLAQAVQMRDREAPRVALEASGGLSPAQLEPVARSGVDRIAIGGLTHSAPALDFGLDIS
jgi:nicotinate-nucleotide pyrophosphorylase (carboxylating)